jgi:hypothetical protein
MTCPYTMALIHENGRPLGRQTVIVLFKEHVLSDLDVASLVGKVESSRNLVFNAGKEWITSYESRITEDDIKLPRHNFKCYVKSDRR